MKTIIIGVLGLACVCMAASDEDAALRKRLREAAEADGPAYVAIRDRIVADTNTNDLYRASSDPSLDWKDRLVARIALERKLRGADVEALSRYDWRKDPEAPEPMKISAAGLAYSMESTIRERFHIAGLWYYYIEINWKKTGVSLCKGFSASWPFHATGGVRKEPEWWYMRKILYMQISSYENMNEDRDKILRYRIRLAQKDADAIPVLVDRFEVFFQAACPTVEIYPGRKNELFQLYFVELLSFADCRHVALLEKYISEHPVLEPLRPKLEEVKKRPAPEPVPEPPFRVMPTPEFLKIGPFVTEHPS